MSFPKRIHNKKLTGKHVPLQPLPRNGTIAVTAPASPPDLEKLNKGVQYLESLGYNVEVGKSCYERWDYLAGKDELRAKELMSFFEAPHIDAIFCARGGFGSLRLLSLLDYESIRKSRKLFCGFSDITALEWAMYAKSGLCSVSGGMVAIDFGRDHIDPDFEDQFWELMQTGSTDIELSGNTDETGTMTGIALPGTLTVASYLTGSPYFPSLDNKLLIIEDIGERRHKIEGYLEHFRLAGALQNVQCVIFGTFVPPDAEEYVEVPTLELLHQRTLGRSDIPYFTGLAYGHIAKKISLPLGVPMLLSYGPSCSLKSQQSIYQV
ncbi:MAG TPA: LD-carboxypeptidase [Balneolales bacterium]|nr:LD-carboxypeptidase [Balneolales bacterium]